MDFDNSWCPVCDRQILPKRYQVPVAPPQPQPTITAPPSSPTSSSPTKNASDAPTIRRSKAGGTIRARAGLVHGTGRVKPNGHLKRADSASKQLPAPAPTPAPVVKPATPVKLRTVIDQGPMPLYCSDECKAYDLANSSGFIAADYDPHRQSQTLPPVPHNSFTSLGSESDSTSSSSVESQSSFERPAAAPAKMSKSLATLAAMYNFPPLPPPAPIFDDATSSSDSEYPREYNSGVMMANRRIEAALCPKPVKRSSHSQPEPRKPIPGWTDGSGAWRAAVYSFSPPTDLSAPVDPSGASAAAKAYGSFVASPHRSRGATPESSSSRNVSSSASSSATRLRETQELYSQYSQSLSRRADSRISTSPNSFSASSAPRRRERPLVAPGAEGKLLVPNVMLKRGGSSSSVSSSAPTISTMPPAGPRRTALRSPLIRSESYGDASDEDAITPSVETRSWSYDNLKTYPVMQPVPRMEKRLESQIINGREVEVEVEVEVLPQFKRLFLFPGQTVTTVSERR